MTETILWGVRVGAPDWDEEILTTKPEHIEPVKEWAARNGFDRFRVARIDLSVPPDFGKSMLNI